MFAPPTEPANSASPTITVERVWKLQPPGVCPGVSSVFTERLPTATVSPWLRSRNCWVLRGCGSWAWMYVGQPVARSISIKPFAWSPCACVSRIEVGLTPVSSTFCSTSFGCAAVSMMAASLVDLQISRYAWTGQPPTSAVMVTTSKASSYPDGTGSGPQRSIAMSANLSPLRLRHAAMLWTWSSVGFSV